METLKRSVVARGNRKEGKNGQSTEDFYNSENTLYNTIIVDISHYTVAKTHRKYTTKSEP